MAMFVVRHEHDAGRCPAQSPEMGGMLLNHLEESNAASQGIKIHGDAVVNGQHTFYLILESDSQANVERFMQPFSMAGSVEIMPSSTCSEVVARRTCD
jgi:hypothetical protein